jgi:hypothetical protein
LWSRGFPIDGRTGDQHDAYSIAAWLARADRDGSLATALNPQLSSLERTTAQVEGWILGAPKERAGGVTRDQIRTPVRRKSSAKTTMPGYMNKNKQEVLRDTSQPGNDHNQLVYVLRCGLCAGAYGANGSDICQRRCPYCQDGANGLNY